MGSYYKKQRATAAPRHVTRSPWLYHVTLPDLLPAIRELGLRPLRDVASRLAWDAAEKEAADAGTDVDPGAVHLYAIEEPLRVALLCRQVAALRVRTTGLDAAFLTRDPREALDPLRSDAEAQAGLRKEVLTRLGLPGDTVLDLRARLAAKDITGALDLIAPFVDAVAERAWEAPPFLGSYRYAGTIARHGIQVLMDIPAELKSVNSVQQAYATRLGLDALRWAPLETANLAAVARGLGRTEFPADPG